MSRDVESLNGVVTTILNLDCETNRDLADFLLADMSIYISPREMAKRLLSPLGLECYLELFKWCSKTDLQNVRSRVIPITKGLASCTIQLYHNFNKQVRDMPRYVSDATAYFDTLVVVDNVVSFEPDGGRKLISCIQGMGLPILVQAGFLFLGDYNEASESGNRCVLNSLVKKYESYGFQKASTRFNDFADYCESVILIYDDNSVKKAKGF